MGLYLKDKKCNESLWDGEIKLKISGSFSLTPINFNDIESEAMMYFVNCNDDVIRWHLPDFSVKDIPEAKEKLLELLGLDASRNSVTLCIRMGNGVIGYVRCLSPSVQKGSGNWSINFWMGPLTRRRNITKAAVSRTLQYLQSHEVDLVDAYIHSANFGGIKILNFCGFNLMDRMGGVRHNHYRVKLGS